MKTKEKKRLLLQRPVNKIKTTDEKNIPPRRNNCGGIPSPS